MRINGDSHLECDVCGYFHTHLVGTIKVNDDDSYHAHKVIVNIRGKDYELDADTRYEYRSQGNISLLFRCEVGHYHIVSFDGHKGNMYVGENALMERIVSTLNAEVKRRGFAAGAGLTVYQLLGIIESVVQ